LLQISDDQLATRSARNRTDNCAPAGDGFDFATIWFAPASPSLPKLCLEFSRQRFPYRILEALPFRDAEYLDDPEMAAFGHSPGFSYKAFDGGLIGTDGRRERAE